MAFGKTMEEHTLLTELIRKAMIISSLNSTFLAIISL